MNAVEPGAQVEPAQAAALRAIPCQAGGCRYWLETHRVQAIRQEVPLKPSFMPKGPLGFTSHQGVETPVYALPSLLDPTARTSFGLRTIIVIRDDPAWAIAVERAGRPADLPPERVFRVPQPLGKTLGGKVRAAVTLDDQISYLLEPAGLIGSGGERRTASPPIRPVEQAFQFPRRAPGRPQVFRFQLPGERDGPTWIVSAGQTAAALNVAAPASLPAPDDDVLGLLVFQGIPVPVLDLGRLLGRAPTLLRHASKLLLVRGARTAQLCALPAGPGLRLSETPRESRAVAPPAGSRCVLGAFEADGEQLWALDLDVALLGPSTEKV